MRSENCINVVRVVGTLVFCLATVLLGPALVEGQGEVERGILVSTDWLEAQLGRSGIVVVHVERESDSVDHYAMGHIPGSRLVITESLGQTRAGVAGAMPPLDDLIEIVRGLGIDSDTKKIVVYGATNPAGPARLFHVLDYLGLGERTALLDGHFLRWMAEGRPTTTMVPGAPYSGFVPSVNPRALIRRDTVGDFMSTLAVRRLDDPTLVDRGFVLFDVRRAGPYASGHIPGAVNADPLFDFVGVGSGGTDPETFWVLNKRQTIVNRYVAMGLDRGELAITSCTTGIAGSLLYFILRYAGFEVALYDGSFNEWSVIQIADEQELDLWREAYPGYLGNDVGLLPVVTGPGRWEPVVE
jgi:thiosulfate/3-mercaptopyruvate sulfurtransferase